MESKARGDQQSIPLLKCYLASIITSFVRPMVLQTFPVPGIPSSRDARAPFKKNDSRNGDIITTLRDVKLSEPDGKRPEETVTGKPCRGNRGPG